VACPPGYEPVAPIWQQALVFAKQSGAQLSLTDNPYEAASGADAIYTDVWASMGQEAEAQARKQIFAPYQVNAQLVKMAQPEAIVMHCLPAHRGEEITDEVVDSKQSVVFDQAENRLHAQKAILSLVL
jgi:ornithine carbamoyltransferase